MNTNTVISIEARRREVPPKTLDSIGDEIERRISRGVRDALEVGALLIEAKELADNFTEWLAARFAWHQRTADRYMQAHRWHAEQPDEIRHCVESRFDLTALYIVSAKKCPDKARAEMIDRAQHGEPVSAKVARDVLKKCRTPKAKPEPTPRDDLLAAGQHFARLLSNANPEDRREALKKYGPTVRKLLKIK